MFLILVNFLGLSQTLKKYANYYLPILKKYKIRKFCRYIKIIFNKKILITFIISLIIFNMYIIILNKKYNYFYKNVEKNIETEAVIISNKKESEYYNIYTIKGMTDEFKNKKFIMYVNKNIEFAYGDKVKVIGEFYEPEGSKNYKQFNYKKYLQTQKIYGTIKAKKIEFKSKNNLTFIFRLNNNVINGIINQVKNIFPQETGGLLLGLMLGDKTYISDEIKLDFQKSSLSHILAVSGSHVSYIVFGLTYFISFTKMSKKSGYFVMIFSLIVFIFITNFFVSVIRACMMSIILIIAKIFYRKPDIINILAISALIISIYNPYSINSVSMQLSYLGTIGVIFITPIINKILRKYISNKKICQILSIPISAQIAILPIMIKNFNTISLTFIISNLIAMPVLGACIIGGYLFVVFSYISFDFIKNISVLFNFILKFLILVARFCGNFKLSNIYVVTPNTVTIVIYYSIIFLVVIIFNFIKNNNGCVNKLKPRQICVVEYLKKVNYKKVITVLIITIILIEIPYTNYNGILKIYFIDVGQRR